MAVIPLESNPEVINKFLHSLGVPEKWQVIDIYGLEDDMLAAVPRPVLSLIMLFPTSQKYEDHCEKENADLESRVEEMSSNVYYMKQYLHNACGTVAIIHSIANNVSRIDLGEGCLKEFIDSTKSLSPEEKGKVLKEHKGIMEAHQAVATEGQTEPPEDDEELEHHFIAFVCIDGQLYELDGIRPFPIPHGPSSPETLLEDASKVVKEFIAREPQDLRFTLMALTAAPVAADSDEI